jgi:hypothetical protein
VAKSVRLTVGASADRSIGRVFDSLVQASARARVQVAANMNAALAGGSGGADRAGRALELLNRQALRQIAQIERAQSAARSRAESDELASMRRKQRLEVAAFDAKLEMSKRASAEERRQIDANAREAERRMRTANDNGVRSRTAVLSQSYSNVAGVARSTLGVARDLGRGAGVDFDLSAALGRSGSTEKLAADVTNSAFAAKGQSASRGDVEATIASIQAAGDAAKVSYADAAAGLTEFVAKSADLDTGKEALGDLAKLARATGSNVRDLVSAAGDVNKELDGGADKGQRLMEVMRLVARQGALGSVEIRSLATYMGRITGTAALFEGGREENIGKLGAIAQLAMKGGRVTAAEATNTSASIFRDLTKPHAIEAFDKAGIGLFADKGKTKMRGPDEILMDVVSKSQGDVTKISDLMKNQVSRAAAISLAKIYSEAGGGAAGESAMRGEFKKYTTSMTGSQVESAAALSMGTREAAAQDFNNRMEKIAASLGDKLLPAFEKMTPTILAATDAWAGVVGWAAENPGMAITTAITASIAKAALGEVVTRAVVSGLAGKTSAMGGTGGGMIAGNLGSGLAIAATAVTLYAAGTVVIDGALDGMKGGADQQENQQFGRENTISRLSRKMARGEGLSKEDERALALARQGTEQDIAAGTDKTGVLGAIFTSKTMEDVGRSDSAEANMEALRADLAKIEALQKGIADLNAKLGGTLQVQVTNMPGGGASVDGESRSGP